MTGSNYHFLRTRMKAHNSEIRLMAQPLELPFQVAPSRRPFRAEDPEARVYGLSDQWIVTEEPH